MLAYVSVCALVGMINLGFKLRSMIMYIWILK